MIEAARILYIEDNRDDAYAAIRVFEKTYIDLEIAHSVGEALKILETKKYDLLICDLLLPGEDGLYFAKWLSESNIRTPLILTSLAPALRSFHNYYGLGNYFGFILKPITPEKIEELLKTNSYKVTAHESAKYS